MNRSRESGFTIVETMMFLAISGLLVIGILGAAGVAINIQRYRDAHNSLISYIQGEYDRTLNVQNDRELKMKCEAGAITPVMADITKGTSDCMIVGRYLTVADNGLSVTSAPVYASKLPPVTAATDITALQASGLFTSTTAEAAITYQLEWGAAIKLSNPSQSKILIVRSPLSGAVRTFVGGASTPTVASMVGDAQRTDIVLCVDPKGLITYAWSGVRVTKDAAGLSAVKQTGDGEC